jgi:outer membrane protein assembly factor BamB
MMRSLKGVLLALAVLLAACAADKPKPTPLQSFTPQIAGRQVWSTRIDGVPFPLTPAVNGDRFTVAAGDGTVLALQANTGAELWRANIGNRIVAGVGSDGRYSSVVTRDNELVTLEGGAEKWRQRLPARVSSAPLVAGERVFVMSVDRVVYAFDAIDGRPLWKLQRPGEALTLAQAAVIAPFKNTLLVGQGARLAGIDPLRGTVQWEVPIATPRGTNEVERLADLVGPPLRIGDTLCMRAFQSAVGCLNGERAALTWTKNVGGIGAVGGDEQLVFGADASDRITAWRTPNGEVAWTSEAFLHRGLSGALGAGKTVVFGDVEGQVHFLSREDGQTLLRLPTNGSPVVGAPVLAGTTMLVVTRNGGLFAFRPE